MTRKVLAATLLLVAAFLLPAASASAALPADEPKTSARVPYPGNEIRHHSPDEGYAAPFRLYCYSGALITVPEGRSSIGQCGNVYAVSLNSGQRMLCYESNGAHRYFYAGVTIVHDGLWSKTYNCTMQLA